MASVDLLPNRVIAAAAGSREKKKEVVRGAMHILSCGPTSENVVQRPLPLVQHQVGQLRTFLLCGSWLQVPLQGPIQAPLLQAHPLVRWRGRLLALVVLPMQHSL